MRIHDVWIQVTIKSDVLAPQKYRIEREDLLEALEDTLDVLAKEFPSTIETVTRRVLEKLTR